MAIHVICGKPGGGKSFYAVNLLVRELRETPRRVVTNLPLKLAELNAYLQRRYPGENLEAATRITLLSDEDTKQFWRHRPGDGQGVAYFLDEAHLHFGARDWATFARDAMLYLSQHRKLGDVVFPITQAPGNLDKQFRSLAEDYIHLRNEYTAQYFIFRGLGRFVVRWYAQDPTNSNRADCFQRATLKLDAAGLAACYETAKGVGVAGTSADKGARARGLPIWTVFPLAIGLASLCFLVPWFLGKGVANFVGGKTSAATAAIQPAIPSTVTIPPTTIPALAAPLAATVPEVRYRGVLVQGSRVVVQLDNGRYLTERDVAAIFADKLILADGTTLWRATDRPAVPSVAPLAPTAAEPTKIE